MGDCNLNLSPAHNWIEDNSAHSGLPPYMKSVACALVRSGHDVTSAIKIAVGRVEVWATGGGKVSASTQAKAAADVAVWEAMRVAAKATPNKVKMSSTEDQDYLEEGFGLSFDDSIFRFTESGDVLLKMSLVDAVRGRMSNESYLDKMVRLSNSGKKS